MDFNNRNVSIGKNVKLGKNVKIGDNTIVYDNVEIGDNTVICANCIIGEPLGSYYSNQDYDNLPLKIGANSLIRSNAIIYSGSVFGDNCFVGHFSVIRERNIFGNNCVIGVYCNIFPDCKIGNYVHFHSYDSIAEESVIEDFVFFYPNVVITSDPTPPSNVIKACYFGKYTQIAANAIIMPGTRIAENSFVSANSQVSGKYKENSFIAGIPAKRVMDLDTCPIVNEETGKRQYPWMNNFSRGMPWAESGFDKWSKE